MFGSFRNPVLALHRVSIGEVALDESLAPGQYRALLPEEIALLRGTPSTGDPSP
jgi:16S rRNA pseudouridine516 synthase